MGRSSKRWVSEHTRDPYVQKARQDNFRSRAAYKLIQMQEKFHLIHPGDWVLDLGAAPGGWSQAAAGIVGKAGRVVAVDLLEMKPIPGVRSIQGDIFNKEILDRIVTELDGKRANLLLSDMAPNTSGVASLDHDRSVLLVESLLPHVELLLRPGGNAVFKVFQGREVRALMERMLPLFNKAQVSKPPASRSKSVEIYLLGRGYRGIG